jgi:hypothetical protein
MRHNYKCRIVWKIEGGVAVKYRYGLVIVLVLVVAGIAAAQTVPSDKTMLIKLERTAVRTAPSFASPVLSLRHIEPRLQSYALRMIGSLAMSRDRACQAMSMSARFLLLSSA